MSPTTPNIITIKKRRYVLNSQKEKYKADLAGIPFQEPAGPDVLVPFKKFAAELGVSVRTVERRVSEARKAAA